MYESGTISALEDERRGATPSWMVPVLKAGAADASSGRRERPMKVRIMDDRWMRDRGGRIRVG